MAPAGASFAGRERIRSGARYRRVLAEGVRLEGPLFALVARENGLPFDRLGLAVGRRVGVAVVRNRAKRLLREAFRRRKRGAEGGQDLVLLAKPGIAGQTQADVDREFEKRLRRLSSRRRPRPGGPDPAPGD